MKFAKPSWVVHDSTNTGVRAKIYSVHVHPDGSRIATGAGDQKINIWSTKPILNEASDLADRIPKKLCTLTVHSGAVICVRWANCGKWLASGSDDQIVMIWDLDPTGKSAKVWGSDVVNVEAWKPLKRLPGHDSDVVDLAWSPGDRYLASVGLDTNVMIWCGFTLERLQKIEAHRNFVKGVCWDPVGEFLATESDDKTVKIWRTSDWQEVTEITKPFTDSPSSTFFRRLSWSPDGAHITAANATSSNGMVFIAAVITRNSWSSDISLVGHENTIQVASYNPHIFLRDPAGQLTASNICSVVALGADDNSISVWQTKAPRPLVVAKEVFDRPIMDLSWAPDGLVLYAASEDGTIAVLTFTPEEMEGLSSQAAKEEYLAQYNHKAAPLPDGYSHQAPVNLVQGPIQTDQTGFESNQAEKEKVTVLVAKPGKKRAALRAHTNIPSAATSNIPSARAAPLAPAPAQSNASAGPSRQRVMIGPAISQAPSPATAPPGPLPTFDVEMNGYNDDVDMDVPIASLSTAKGKRKASDAMEDGRTGKRFLGPREKIASVKELEMSGYGFAVGSGPVQNALPIPALMNFLSVKVDGNADDSFEARNGEDNEINEVAYMNKTKTLWLDFLPSPAVAIIATTSFCAVSMKDGSVNVYSPNGRKTMPTLTLGSPSAYLEGSKNTLMVITVSGKVYSFNVKKASAHFAPVSILALLSSSPNCTIITASVRANGNPIIHCSTDVVHSYDPMLCSWVKVGDSWWLKGSENWSGRARTNNTGTGVVATIESSITSKANVVVLDSNFAARPQWWDTAFTLGHLECRLSTAKLLDSPTEYKSHLLQYATRIGNEGFKGKAEELVKELLGPIYWRPGMDEGAWAPTVLGFQKRDLLKDVLSVLTRSKPLKEFGSEWMETYKQVVSTKED